MHQRAVAVLSVPVLVLSGGIVFLLVQDRQTEPLSEGRTYVGASYEQPGSTRSDDSGSGNTNRYGRTGEGGSGQQVQVENDPDRVYGEIYTVSVYCEEVTSTFGGTLSGYCDSPVGLSDTASCIEENNTFSMSGGRTFLCKPSYGSTSQSHPDQIILENAPEDIYTVEVHCENETEQFGTTYGDCDWPMFDSPNNDCIEVESRSPFSTGTDYLCKP